MMDGRSFRRSAEPPDRSTGGASESPATAPDVGPLTWAALGRFFGLPLLIIGTIVGGAVVVVLLFGGPAGPQVRSIESLLQSLESSSGEKSVGVLLPREKELWQTALELSERLRHKDTELTKEEVETTTRRLVAMVELGLANLERVSAFGDDLARQKRLRSGRLEFLLHALGRTESNEAFDSLISVVRTGRGPYAAVAMQELANLHHLPGSKRAVKPILAMLTSQNQADTLIVAATALSVLGSGDDPRVIDALASTTLSHDGEVAWSAALALARLGSDRAKSTLLDLLDRRFWETGERYRVMAPDGTVRLYPMPPARIDQLLVAAIEAVSNLGNAELWEVVEGLQTDASPAVRGAVAKAMGARTGTGINAVVKD